MSFSYGARNGWLPGSGVMHRSPPYPQKLALAVPPSQRYLMCMVVDQTQNATYRGYPFQGMKPGKLHTGDTFKGIKPKLLPSGDTLVNGINPDGYLTGTPLYNA
eukprot:361369-Chlamydomonas_euryale.AAC.2